MNKSIENDIVKGEFIKHILSGNHKMKSIMTSQLSCRCVGDYYSKCLGKFIPTDNQNIRHILNLNDELYDRLKTDNIEFILQMYFIDNIIIRSYNGHDKILWKYIEKIINIPDHEMTPEVIELMQYIMKVLY